MARPRSDIYKRFFSKVNKTQDCWEWQSTIKKDGYGSFHFNGRQEQAHRVSYILNTGEIPEGMKILHKCDNRKCVNPDHLFIGTLVDNVKDMDSKQRRGTRSKLTYDDVEQIKKLLADRYSQVVIGKMFGVCQNVISKIKLKKTRLFKS